eukprot:s69_g11.t1
MASIPRTCRARALVAFRRCRGIAVSRFCRGSETHGGDDIHKVERLVCDFSVTTNALGPVPSALVAVQDLLHPQSGAQQSWMAQQVMSSPAVEHYPQRKDQELEGLVAKFLRGTQGEEAKKQLIFGNGASELIDLLARAAPQGNFCLNPSTEVQYREYQRACSNAGREETSNPQEASIICLVNPNNPTGDFWEREEMQAWISANAAPGSWVLVDESMLFWAGQDFQERGVSAQFVDAMVKKHINIFLVQSWTKIFACTGLRIGTVLCPTQEKRDFLLSLQVPWSVTAFARAYLKAAVQDRSYLERTWEETPAWRSHMVTRLKRLHPSWQFHGKPWLSWIWIDTGSPDVAKDVYRAALNCGCPIRHAASGYDKPTVVRLAVRRPYDFSVLYQALLRRESNSTAFSQTTFGTSADVNPDVISGVRLVHIDDLHPHEEVLTDRADKLKNYDVVIDGHHRLELFKAAGLTIVPAVSVHYEHPDILVNPPGLRPEVCKEQVIGTAVKGKTMEPKTTQHMVRSRGGALLPIIVLAPQIAEVVSEDARWCRRVVVVTFLLGLFRTSLLNWDVTDAGKIFIPTISWGALISLVMLLVSQLYVRAYALKAAATEAANAPEEAEAEQSEHSQYSSALTFLQTVRVLRPYFWPTSGRPSEVLMNRIRALTTWLCVVLSKVSNIISPIFLARATNALASALQRRSLEITPEIWWPLVEYAALVFLSKSLKEAQSLVYIKVQQAASIEIADNTFAHLHSLSLDWHLRKKMGQTVRSMDRGIQAAQQTMQYVVLYLIPTLVEALAVALIFVFHFKNLQLAVFVLLNLIAYMYATIKVTLWRKKFRTATTKHDNDLHDRLTDSLVNYETVKYFTAEDYERREYRSLVESYQKTSMATQASLSFLNILQQLIVNFTLCGGMILATLRVLQTNGNLGDFVAVNTYIINVFTPLNFLGTIYNMVVNAIVDMKNFGQLLAERSEVQDAPNAPALNLQMSPDVPMVAFEQVCFHYSKQPLGRAIKDVNFRIPPGNSLALVGTTGAGKTTITRLLFRFYDVVSGCVRVNGQDVRKVSQKSLRAAIGMVPQDVVLFNSTIAHNLRYGNVDKASEKDIQKAAVDAQLDSFIDQQAKGYETMVGERGLKLSGGEKQRLAIARCLVKDPPIVVLDEATSALDSETEQKIQEALKVLSASRTVIAIAHRLSTIRAYDEICVLQNGEIVERGNHEALLSAGQSYSTMWKRQAAGIMEDPDSPGEEIWRLVLALVLVEAMARPRSVGELTHQLPKDMRKLDSMDRFNGQGCVSGSASKQT